MRLVIQRVREAEIVVDESVVSRIENGLLVFLGIGGEDSENDIVPLVNKLTKMRIFSDSDDKMNLSVTDLNYEIMVVSQFTLYADCKKGNRPSFTAAAPPSVAEMLYEKFIDECKKITPNVKNGVFGGDMKISLLNDGPVTIILDSADLIK